MKIIITGATGTFGGAMTRYFSLAGHEVIAVGRKEHPPQELLKYASYLQADILYEYTLPEADVIIHAAAFAEDKANLHELLPPNVTGVENTLKASKGCKKFIYISSSSVYLPDEKILTEELAGNQNSKMLSAYGKSKLLGEEVIHNNFNGDSCFILRPRVFYGPGDTQILPRLLKLVKKGVFKRPGPMEISLSMTHYLNMAHGIECCINSDLKGVRTYNIADDQVYIMKEVFRKIFSATYKKKLPEKQIKIGFLKFLAFFRIGGISPLLVRSITKNIVLDITKIKEELHYRPVITLDDSVDELGKWVEQIGGPEALEDPEYGLTWKAFN